MDNICKICSAEISQPDEFGDHLKLAHKISKKKYIEKYFPKYDLLDRSVIEYKSDDQYKMYDFNSVKNLNAWIKKQDSHEIIEYFNSKIFQYCSLKKIEYLPSYLELSLVKPIPSADLVEKLCDIPFNEACEGIGLPAIFDYSTDVGLIKKLDVTNLVIDTREQLPFQFSNIQTMNSKLDYGDYAVSKTSLLAIERKSLNDLRSTLSSGIERFKREIFRAAEKGGYIVVLVESTLENFLYQKSRFGKCSPDFLAHNLRSILREYNNIQFVFAETRQRAQSLVVKILSLNEFIKFIDLQYFLVKCRL